MGRIYDIKADDGAMGVCVFTQAVQPNPRVTLHPELTDVHLSVQLVSLCPSGGLVGGWGGNGKALSCYCVEVEVEGGWRWR